MNKSVSIDIHAEMSRAFRSTRFWLYSLLCARAFEKNSRCEKVIARQGEGRFRLKYNNTNKFWWSFKIQEDRYLYKFFSLGFYWIRRGRWNIEWTGPAGCLGDCNGNDIGISRVLCSKRRPPECEKLNMYSNGAIRVYRLHRTHA